MWRVCSDVYYFSLVLYHEDHDTASYRQKFSGIRSIAAPLHHSIVLIRRLIALLWCAKTFGLPRPKKTLGPLQYFLFLSVPWWPQAC